MGLQGALLALLQLGWQLPTQILPACSYQIVRLASATLVKIRINNNLMRHAIW
jgi:hypothetical protein